jgi:hypothetical protein
MIVGLLGDGPRFQERVVTPDYGPGNS